MKWVNATEVKNHLGAVLNDARSEPVVVTSYGRPTHVVLDYEAYQELVQPGSLGKIADIADPIERVRRFREWVNEMTALTSPDVPPLTHEHISRDSAYE